MTDCRDFMMQNKTGQKCSNPMKEGDLGNEGRFGWGGVREVVQLGRGFKIRLESPATIIIRWRKTSNLNPISSWRSTPPKLTACLSYLTNTCSTPPPSPSITLEEPASSSTIATRTTPRKWIRTTRSRSSWPTAWWWALSERRSSA